MRAGEMLSQAALIKAAFEEGFSHASEDADPAEFWEESTAKIVYDGLIAEASRPS